MGELPIEWLPEIGNAGALVVVLVWLIWAITSGKLVSGKEARRLAEAQRAQIERQAEQINILLEAALIGTKVADALPKIAEDGT